MIDDECHPVNQERNIFTVIANELEELDNRVILLLNNISSDVKAFKSSNSNKQQILLSAIQEKVKENHEKFYDELLKLSCRQDILEKAVFELQNTNKADLADDLKNRFEALKKSFGNFFRIDLSKGISNFGMIQYMIEAGLILKETVRQLRRIAASLQTTAEIRNSNGQTALLTYSVFLMTIAGQVNSLIEQHRDRFAQMVTEFEDRFNRWKKEFDRIYQNAIDNPYLQFDENKPKRKKVPANYILYDLNEQLEDNPREDGKFHFWGPPIPFNPVDTLRKRHFLQVLLRTPEDSVTARNPMDVQEDVLRKYYLLAVIHAFCGHELGVGVINKQCLEDPGQSTDASAMLVWEQYEDSPNRAHRTAEMSLIKAALDTVNKDVNSITQKDTSHTNRSKDDHLTNLPKSQIKVLDALNTLRPEIPTIDDLEKESKLSRGTVCNSLKHLRKHGFVSNDTGQNVITSEGIAFLTESF
jgi:hypothetical protein